MPQTNPGQLFLRIAAHALVMSVENAPIIGPVLRIGRECWLMLKDAQDNLSQEERITQIEQAGACSPEEARKIAEQVLQELRQQGTVVDNEQANAIQGLMSAMPAQIRDRTQTTLRHARRLGTAAVTVLPVTSNFSSAEREAFYTGLFPPRAPQYNSGDTIPNHNPEWHLERLLGIGGFGEVWLARHRYLDDQPPWAVKLCQDATSAKILKSEASNLYALRRQLPANTKQTRHIVALLDLQLTAMPYWLAFEYIDGGTLESRMRLGPLNWAAAWDIFEPILDAMIQVHSLNIVHRDLKPANILLDQQLQPHIADFGIGKILADQDVKQRNTQASVTVAGYGTFGYMSPEQQQQLPAHTSDDVYALGVILWQLLAGGLKALNYSAEIETLPVPKPVKQAIIRCVFLPRAQRPADALELKKLLVKSKPAKKRCPNCLKVLLIVACLAGGAVLFSRLNLNNFLAQRFHNTTNIPIPHYTAPVVAARQAFEPEMVSIPAGSFMMGSPESEAGRYGDEGPQHRVTVKAFQMAKYETTFAEYDAFCEATGRAKPDDRGWGRGNRPVINVTWDDAVAYTKWLSQQTGKDYRLPTEAQWEYAARAGSTSRYFFGDDANRLGDYAWYDGNSNSKTHPVGQKQPNAWGLYDVHGNVWEWTQDRWHGDYSGAPTDGSAWESGDSPLRVLRGGSWGNYDYNCRTAYRNGSGRGDSNGNWGFRVACFLG